MMLPVAWAQDPVYKLPMGKIIQDHKAYSLDEMKVILHIYADYNKYRAILPEKDKQLLKYEDFTQNLTEQLKLRGTEVEILQSERKLLTAK